MRRALVAAVAVALAVGATACGSKGNGMSDAAQRQLSALVGQVRNAADARDATGAGRALYELSATVHRYEQNGDLSSARADEILGAATQVAGHLALITTTTTTTTTTTMPAPPPPPPKKDHHDKHGDHKGPGGGGD